MEDLDVKLIKLYIGQIVLVSTQHRLYSCSNLARRLACIVEAMLLGYLPNVVKLVGQDKPQLATPGSKESQYSRGLIIFVISRHLLHWIWQKSTMQGNESPSGHGLNSLRNSNPYIVCEKLCNFKISIVSFSTLLYISQRCLYKTLSWFLSNLWKLFV